MHAPSAGRRACDQELHPAKAASARAPSVNNTVELSRIVARVDTSATVTRKSNAFSLARVRSPETRSTTRELRTPLSQPAEHEGCPTTSRTTWAYPCPCRPRKPRFGGYASSFRLAVLTSTSLDSFKVTAYLGAQRWRSALSVVQQRRTRRMRRPESQGQPRSTQKAPPRALLRTPFSGEQRTRDRDQRSCMECVDVVGRRRPGTAVGSMPGSPPATNCGAAPRRRTTGLAQSRPLAALPLGQRAVMA